MKLHLLDRSQSVNAISVKKNSYPYFLKIWHYHPELELVLVLKSKGTRFIGDSIQRFQPNDLVLIGKNLPHMWLNDAKYFEEETRLAAEAIAIHFKQDFLGEPFFNLPEMKSVAILLEQAGRGLHFKNISPGLKNDILHLASMEGFDRLHLFLQILHKLSAHEEIKILASPGYLHTLKIQEPKLSDKVIAYIFNNFNNDISLSAVAELVDMNPSAFSRSFKRVHRKTFSTYVNEIKIGYACKLLMENELNVAAVAYESGFNNLSNFNRQFKNITAMAPSEYMRKHAKRA